VSAPRDYRPLVDLANAAAAEAHAQPIARIETVRLTIDLPVVQARQLGRLATFLNRAPAEIAVEAIKRHLADPVSRPGTLPSDAEK